MKIIRQHKRHLFGVTISILLVCLLLYIYLPPEIESPSKKTFVNFILPRAQQANLRILLQRKKLTILYNEFKNKKPLTPLSKDWLLFLANRYDVKHPNLSQNSTWKTLFNRVDIVPNSLVIAQAIDESNWGQSRFAQDEYDYFGVWCYTKGCGITPSKATGSYHAVKRYVTPLLSVENYMRNINSHNAYREFRNARALLRDNHKAITGLNLVNTLIYYSQRREAYVNEIRALIKKYNLTQYDSQKYLDSTLTLTIFFEQFNQQKTFSQTKRTIHHPNISTDNGEINS
jgi:Bax protein